MRRPDHHHPSIDPAKRFAALLALVLGVPLSLLVGCGGTPEPAPPPKPTVSATETAAQLADHPWDITPPETLLAFAPGADPGPGTTPPAVYGAARLWSHIADVDADPAERAAWLLERVRPTCAIGRYGLPLDPDVRGLFARMFVRHLDTMNPDVDALSLPWHYRLITVREFATLPPAAIHGWEVQLRIGDMPQILESGGALVLLGPKGDVANWMLCTLWMPGLKKVAALHVLRSRRKGGP
ncbi:MAG: hypothetical protein AB7K09_18480 [Planctomycetota bacterium]